MSAAQVRKALAFSGRRETETALGRWAVTVYSRARTHSSLRVPSKEGLQP